MFHHTGLDRFGGAAGFDLLEYIRQLVAQEDRDDRRGRFVGAQAMIVAGRSHHRAQHALMRIDRTNDRSAKHQELGVVMRRVAGIEQVAVGRRSKRPVDVLARAVDAREGLLVRQTGHTVFLGDRTQLDHDQLLMIGCYVGALEHRCNLVLARRHLVVARLDRDAELEQLTLDLEHEAHHAVRDRAEVVVVELLAFGRRRAKQRTAGVEQVGPREIEVAVDEKVLLLGTGRGGDQCARLVAKQPQDALRLLVERLAGAQHRGLLVESFAGPGDERGGNAERRSVGVLHDVGRARDIPSRVAARLEGCANAAGREAGAVRLALNQGPAGEL